MIRVYKPYLPQVGDKFVVGNTCDLFVFLEDLTE